MGTEYEKDKNCDSTGQKKPVIIVGEQKQEEKKKNSNLSVNSLVFGIISLISIPAIYVSVMLAAVGLISGIISLAQRREGKKIAIAGFLVSIAGLVINLAFSILVTIGRLLPA